MHSKPITNELQRLEAIRTTAVRDGHGWFGGKGYEILTYAEMDKLYNLDIFDRFYLRCAY